MPILSHPCRTCPFAGREPVELHPDALAEDTRQIVTLRSQHLCHSADRAICRGGRDLMLRVLFAMRLIDQPTDAAFTRASRAALAERGE
ncbi:MAG: hypothetical protein Q8R16_01730 [bacterium]|nr:hypothetical protein [bacterium]